MVSQLPPREAELVDFPQNHRLKKGTLLSGGFGKRRRGRVTNVKSELIVSLASCVGLITTYPILHEK